MNYKLKKKFSQFSQLSKKVTGKLQTTLMTAVKNEGLLLLWHLAFLASFYHTTPYNILSYKILQHTSVAFSIRRKKFLQKSLDSFKEVWNFSYSSFFQKCFELSERILLTQFCYDLHLFSIWFRLQLWMFWIIESPTIRTIIFLIFHYVMHIDLI